MAAIALTLSDDEKIAVFRKIAAAWEGKQWPVDVPILKEAGLDIVGVAPFWLAKPKNIDPIIFKTLFDVFDRARQDSEYLAICDQYVFEPTYKTSVDISVGRSILTEESVGFGL